MEKRKPGRPPGPQVKSSQEQADQRRAEVRRALSRCEARYDICTRLSAEWAVSFRQVDKYIEQVREQAAAEMAARGEDERRADVRELVDTLRDVVAMARQRKDGRTVVAAVRELAKIHGAYAPEKHEVTGANGAPLVSPPVVDLSRFSDEETEAFSRLLSRVVVRAPAGILPAAENLARGLPGASGSEPGAEPAGEVRNDVDGADPDPRG